MSLPVVRKPRRHHTVILFGKGGEMKTERRTPKQLDILQVLACVVTLLAGLARPAMAQQGPADAELPANVVSGERNPALQVEVGQRAIAIPQGNRIRRPCRLRLAQGTSERESSCQQFVDIPIHCAKQEKR